jgi:glutamate synthase domain-containing protein 2
MAVNYFYPEYLVERDYDRCINCKVCQRQCANGVHEYDAESDKMVCDSSKCVNCQRCVSLCPTRALKIVKSDNVYKSNCSWSQSDITDIYRQAESGGVLLSSMGVPKEYPIYWDKMLINASQVTNPSIDPLREPMETRVFLGKRPENIQRDDSGKLVNNCRGMLKLNLPIMFSAMSYGSISYNAHESIARAARELGTYYNTGEGGLHRDFYKFADNTIVQVASGRFGVSKEYLNNCAAMEIKIGQGAKPGIGGHLPGSKIGEDISKTRMIPEGSDAISPAPHHDIYSIEDLRQLVYSLKEATDYKKPVIVKIAAVHNVSAIASGIARSGADIIAIDGFRGGTGAAPTRIRDNVGIPIELALASVDRRLRQEGIRENVSLVIGGSIRSSADIVKAIALGADAVYIATAALIALGCHLCRSCHTGNCNWGIATQKKELVKRLNPEIGYKRLVNLLTAWEHEIKEFMGGMGINSVEALKGNRLMLRGVGLNETELNVLGIKHAGEVFYK